MRKSSFWGKSAVCTLDMVSAKSSEVRSATAPQVYAPSRTVVVYAPAEYVDSQADQKPMGVPGLAVKGVGPYFGV